MSGTMMPQPPPQMPPQGMAPPAPPQRAGGAPPQIPPQVLQMLMQRMQGAQGGAPGGQQMSPGPPGDATPIGMPKHLQPPSGVGGAAGDMASQGRNGDMLMAHLTPGEIQIPPQIQTPQLMAAIQAAFAQAGLNPAQFVAGSPQASVNPQTGAAEFNANGFLQYLPALAGMAASVAAPYLAPAALATTMGSALAPAAAGLAAGATSAATGGSATQALLSGAGAAGGSYLGGMGAGGGGGGAATVPATDAMPVAATSAGPNPYGAGANPEIGAMSTAAQTGTTQVASPMAVTPANASQAPINWGQAFKAGMGASLGGAMAPNEQKSNVPSSFNEKMPPLNTNYGQILGSNQANKPTFKGYNPYAAASGQGYRFFPTT